jgi:hypothetical protein
MRVKIYYEKFKDKWYRNFSITKERPLDAALKKFCEDDKPQNNGFDNIVIEFVVEE